MVMRILMEEAQKRLLRAICEANREEPTRWVPVVRFARGVGLSYSEAVEVLDRLVECGLVHRAGNSRILSDVQVKVRPCAWRVAVDERRGEAAWAGGREDAGTNPEDEHGC